MKKTRFVSLCLIVTAFFAMSFVIAEDWYLQETKNCKIYFPRKPEYQNQKLASAIGELSLEIYMYQSEDPKDDNLVYGLVETAYPDSTISSEVNESTLDAFWKGAVEGAVKNVQGKLISETPMDYKGFPGRELKVDYKDGVAIITMRMYLVKNRIYALQTITDPAHDNNAASKKFMSSFELLK